MPRHSTQNSTPANDGQAASAWIFIAPWLVGLVVLYLYPFAASFYWSFCEYDLLSAPEPTGLENYERLAAQMVEGGDFRQALWNTLYFAVIAVPATVLVGIGMALALAAQTRWLALGRTLVYLPSILPTVASAVLWMWILDPRAGPVAHGFAAVGLTTPQWFQGVSEGFVPSTFFQFGSKDALVMMTVWAAGNWIIIYLAGILNIPRSLYEAAALDGAGPLRRLWHITVPKLSPIIFFNVVMGIIESIQIFTPAYVVSEGTGEPAGATLLISLYLFQTAFSDLRMGVASAVSWILFLLLAIVTWWVFRSSRRWVHIDA